DTAIKENFLGQLSDQVLHAGLDGIASSRTPQSIYNEVLNDLQQGRHPLITIPFTAQHCVVAYGLEPGTMGNGDFYIDVYDPNRPETADEDQSGSDHLTTYDASRVHITPGDGS